MAFKVGITIKLLFFLSVLAWFSAWADMDQQVSEEWPYIREAGQGYINVFGSNGILFVGLGRAPSAVIAYLQLQKGVHAINLPLSELRNHGDVSSYSELDWNRIRAHFDKFLQIPSGTIQIVTMDYASSGCGLMNGSKIISTYLREKRINVIVTPVVLAAKDDPYYEAHPEVPWGRVLVSGRASMAIYDSFKQCSEFGKADILRGRIVEAISSPEYLELKNKLSIALKNAGCEIALSSNSENKFGFEYIPGTGQW